MAKNEKSGSNASKIASKVLKHGPSVATAKELKSLAASVLTQSPDKKK
jgi:hypothetical protein